MNSECRPRTINRSSSVSIASSTSVLVRRIDPICAVGKITEPGCSTFTPSTRWRIPTSRSVPMSTEPSSASAMSLTFWRIGLGLRAGTTPLTIPNAVSNASRLHKALIRDFLLQALDRFVSKPSPALRLRERRRRLYAAALVKSRAGLADSLVWSELIRLSFRMR